MVGLVYDRAAGGDMRTAVMGPYVYMREGRERGVFEDGGEFGFTYFFCNGRVSASRGHGAKDLRDTDEMRVGAREVRRERGPVWWERWRGWCCGWMMEIFTFFSLQTRSAFVP